MDTALSAMERFGPLVAGAKPAKPGEPSTAKAKLYPLNELFLSPDDSRRKPLADYQKTLLALDAAGNFNFGSEKKIYLYDRNGNYLGTQTREALTRAAKEKADQIEVLC